MLERREEQKERVWKEENKGQWSLLQPCSRQSDESLSSSVRKAALCVLSTGGLSFPGLPSHGCALQPVLPMQTDVCSGLQRAGWKVQLCSKAWSTQGAPGGEHALLTDYQMDEHIIWTPRRLPRAGLASPAPRCIWIYWKELAPFKGFPFMCPTPHTLHTFCQSCDGLLMWWGRVMREVLSRSEAPKTSRICWRHWRTVLPWKHLIPFRWEAPTCVTLEPWITHKRLDSQHAWLSA